MSKPETYRVLAARKRRRAKLHELRKKYNNSTSYEEKSKILEKVNKTCPWLSKEDFLGKKEESK